MMPDVNQIQFDLPGWEDTLWEIKGDALWFSWTMPHSSIPGKTVTVHTEAVLSQSASFEQAAWFCVRLAVLHEAGEHFRVGSDRPYHPHHFKWWELEYKAGPKVLEPTS